MLKIHAFTVLSCFLLGVNSSALEVSDYIKNFKAGIDAKTGAVKIFGLVHPDCQGMIKIKIENLDTDRTQNDIPVYPVRVIFETAESSKCTTELASGCTTVNCKPVSLMDGLLSTTATDGSSEQVDNGVVLKKTGKLVLRVEDYNLDPADPGAISDKSLGDNLVFKDSETLRTEAEVIAKQEFEDKLAIACEKAVEGDLTAIEDLDKLGAQKELITDLTKQANRIQFENAIDTLGQRIQDAGTLTEFEVLLADIQKLSKKATPDDKSLINELLGLLYKQSKESGAQDDGDQNKHFRFEKKLWKFARKLNPKSERVKLAYAHAALEQARWASQTGDQGYYQSALPDARAAGSEIARLAARQNASADMLRASEAFEKSFRRIEIPFTPFVYHYGVGTGLDKTYAMKLNSLLEQEQTNTRLESGLRRVSSYDSDTDSRKSVIDDFPTGDIY